MKFGTGGCLPDLIDYDQLFGNRLRGFKF